MKFPIAATLLGVAVVLLTSGGSTATHTSTAVVDGQQEYEYDGDGGNNGRDNEAQADMIAADNDNTDTKQGNLRAAANTNTTDIDSFVTGRSLAEEASRQLFGGEDMFHGRPWWHEKLSDEAAKDFGFSSTAGEDVAWHADYTDSYNYNPFYWFSTSGFIKRFKAAMSINPDLAKVHNDDLFTTRQVISAQYRYMTGCLIGLKWAAEIHDKTYHENVDPIGAAHNILGVTFHSIQDFYSHSNWIDKKSRRDKVFFDLTPSQMKKEYLYTGSYEKKGGIKPHGKFSIVCSLTAKGSAVGGALKWALNIYCLVKHNDDICREYRDCANRDPAHVGGGAVLGVNIPKGVLYQAPPGINLDNSWQAKIGVKVRRIDLSGPQAFALAKKLAVRASAHMLEIAENFMIAEGHRTFWNKVKTQSSRSPKEDQFEKFNHFPFQFLSTGTYPVSGTDNGYYLRVVLKTSTKALSGTDADIHLEAGGKKYTLNYMPDANPIIAYNDFETGDETVYTVGPFRTFPRTIKLVNDAPNFGDILHNLAKNVVAKIKGIGHAIRRFFTNKEDYVGTNGITLEPDELNSIRSGQTKHYSVYINGGSEGKYTIYFQVKRTSYSTTDKFVVRIKYMKCNKESKIDGWSSSDEPWLMAGLYSYGNPSRKQFYRKGPWGGVDTGETRSINYSFSPVYFSKPFGAMALSFVMYESDGETSGDRNRIYNSFREKTPKEVDGFFSTVGEAIAADWRLDWIKVYGFQRGQTSMKAGRVLQDFTDRWIEGGKSYTWRLDSRGLKTLSRPDVKTPAPTPAPTNAAAVPPPTRRYVLIRFILYNTYLKASSGTATTLSTRPGSYWEKWVLYPVRGKRNTYYIRHRSGAYLASKKLRCFKFWWRSICIYGAVMSKTNTGSPVQWMVKPKPNGQYSIRSIQYGSYLRGLKSGAVSLYPRYEPRWTIRAA